MLKRMLSLLASLALLLTCGAAAVALGENELPIIKPGEKPDTPEEPTPLKTAADRSHSPAAAIRSVRSIFRQPAAGRHGSSSR